MEPSFFTLRYKVRSLRSLFNFKIVLDQFKQWILVLRTFLISWLVRHLIIFKYIKRFYIPTLLRLFCLQWQISLRNLYKLWTFSFFRCKFLRCYKWNLNGRRLPCPLCNNRICFFTFLISINNLFPNFWRILNRYSFSSAGNFHSVAKFEHFFLL